MDDKKTKSIQRYTSQITDVIILARGGSKSLHLKNIKLFNGKPLIAYTIEAALKSQYVDNCYVSTDSEKIAKVARDYGAKVIDRPIALARDDSTSAEALIHSIKLLKKQDKARKWYIHLQPTSPLRTFQDVDNAVRLFLREQSSESVVSCCKVAHHPYKTFLLENNQVRPLKTIQAFESPRQRLPKCYKINGAVYVFETEYLLEQHKIVSLNFVPYFMNEKRSIDIDSELDFKIAECIMKEEYDEKD